MKEKWERIKTRRRTNFGRKEYQQILWSRWVRNEMLAVKLLFTNGEPQKKLTHYKTMLDAWEIRTVQYMYTPRPLIGVYCDLHFH